MNARGTDADLFGGMTVCGDCHGVLNWVALNDGPGQWIHGSRVPFPHEPVPVAGETISEVATVCDVCSTPAPEWLVPIAATPQTVEIAPGKLVTINDDDGWLVCDDCVSLVRARDANEMLKRSMDKFLGPMRGLPPGVKQEQLRETRKQIRALHAHFLASVSEEPHRIRQP